jgi:hypothetical protein
LNPHLPTQIVKHPVIIAAHGIAVPVVDHDVDGEHGKEPIDVEHLLQAKHPLRWIRFARGGGPN